MIKAAASKEMITLKTSLKNHIKQHHLIMNGVDKKLFKQIAQCLGLSQTEMANILPTSVRSIFRKREKEKFDISVSEHLIGLAKIILEAQDLFDSPQEFREWLVSPNKTLRSAAPIELIKTICGCEFVRQILGRARHGVFS
ncbi:MAG: DUF2384 domain-containing protein [Candidatus Omnitrophica bacterium]|nr:DUF2384 domain-containing protein [Candidatus Omnitrophota bacterium]